MKKVLFSKNAQLFIAIGVPSIIAVLKFDITSKLSLLSSSSFCGLWNVCLGCRSNIICLTNVFYSVYLGRSKHHLCKIVLIEQRLSCPIIIIHHYRAFQQLRGVNLLQRRYEFGITIFQLCAGSGA